MSNSAPLSDCISRPHTLRTLAYKGIQYRIAIKTRTHQVSSIRGVAKCNLTCSAFWRLARSPHYKSTSISQYSPYHHPLHPMTHLMNLPHHSAMTNLATVPHFSACCNVPCLPHYNLVDILPQAVVVRKVYTAEYACNAGCPRLDCAYARRGTQLAMSL